MGSRSRRRAPGRSAAPRGPTPESWVLAALVGLTPVVFWRATDSMFATPKLLLVVVLTVVALVLRARGRTVPSPAVPPWGPVLVATTAFVVAAAVATLVSDAPMLSVLGHHGRYSGLVAYATGATLLLLVATSPDRRLPGLLAQALALAGATVGAYAVLQRLGLDPLGEVVYLVEIAGEPSTLGNPNFASAHAAIGLAVGAGLLAAAPTRRTGAVAGVVCLLSFGGLVAANAIQGYLAALAAVAVVLVGVALRRWPARRHLLGGVVAAGVLVGAATVALGAAGSGPLRFIAGRTSTQLRLWDWQAALSMSADRPLLGVGLDRYGAYAHAHRPPAAADVLGPEVTLGAAHSVPLQLLTGGGVVLLLAYLAVVVLVGWVLVVGMGRPETGDHRLLTTLGAAWAAYQVQGLVSIDVPSLLVTHWALAGAVLAVAGRAGTVALPPALNAVWRRSRPAAPVIAGVVGAALLVAPVGVLQVADRHSGLGQRERAAGDLTSAVDRGERAVAIAGWEPHYGEQLAFSRGEAGDGPGALQALADATAADPRALSPQLNAARLAMALGDAATAAARYRVVVRLEPHHVGLFEEAADAMAAAEGPDAAAALVEELVARRPDSSAAWALAAERREVSGDVEGARAATERARALEDADESSEPSDAAGP